MTSRLLLVGNTANFHVGGHLMSAARKIGVAPFALDSSGAYGRGLWQRAMWRAGRWPVRIASFEQAVVERCKQVRPRWLLATGIAPLRQAALSEIGALGVRRINFLTDDPWNPAHQGQWFVSALREYDTVFTPREANCGDLAAAGCNDVRYLPFAYDPDRHYPEPGGPVADVLFVGGGDRDRVGIVGLLLAARTEVTLHGGYWDRFPTTRSAAQGQADPAAVRRATTAAKVSLILIRRANRDGHVMRTYEAAACGGCLLVEDTPDHRRLFGADGECVAYFGSSDELITQARALLADESVRRRLSVAAHRRVTVEGRHTYTDRLKSMLEMIGS